MDLLLRLLRLLELLRLLRPPNAGFLVVALVDGDWIVLSSFRVGHGSRQFREAFAAIAGQHQGLKKHEDISKPCKDDQREQLGRLWRAGPTSLYVDRRRAER